MKIQNVFIAALFSIAAGVLVPSNLIAQATEKQRVQLSQIDSTRTISVTTLDGSTFVGRVVATRPESIDLVTSAGKLRLHSRV